jgi:aquaporin PIP
VFAATDALRAENKAHLPVLAPMAIGFTVFICHLVAIPIDGCSINPARSFAAAVVYGRWTDMWIFWVGPFSGATIAALTYELAFRPSRKVIKGADGQLELPTQGGPDLDAPVARLPPFSGESGLKPMDDIEQQKINAELKTSPREFDNGR